MEDIISLERADEIAAMENAPNVDKRLVIFADYGLDDAVATVHILRNRKEYDFIDIVPVGGNVMAFAARINLRKLLVAAKEDGISLEGVRMVNGIEYYQNSCPLPSVHGKDGMGDLFPDCLTNPVEEIAFDDWLGEIAPGYRILSLGPCTMVRRTYAYAKNLPSGRTIIMGGCHREKPNYGKYEFNDGIDHFAFKWMYRRPHYLVTLDTCRVPAFNLAGTRKTDGGLFDKLVNRAIELAEARHEDNSYIYDYIASVALLRPELFEVNEIFVPDMMRNVYELKLKEEYWDRHDLL